MTTKDPIPNPARPFTISRIFDAPREVVFEAWTNPKQMREWWGPKGFTTPHCKIDLRPGGTIHYCMRSPDGKDYWGIGVYKEILKPSRIVLSDSFSDEKGDIVQPAVYGMDPEWPAETLITVLFDNVEGKTKVTINHSVSDALAKKQGCEEGWSQTLDNLAAFLSKARV
ncbi:MAG: SRPBCC domain-containing protein [Parachlamydiales bacterium]|jgi:uncharacterized protein YndB with AHSA1/START domain